MKNKLKLIFFIILIFLFSCNKGINNNLENIPIFTSFRDIPGVTTDEISAILALQERSTPLTYATSRSTELFEKLDGSLGGFTVLFCNWLEEIFDIQFQPEIQGLNTTLANLISGDISFATLSDTPERRNFYFATEPIAQRSIKILRADNIPITNSNRNRLPRYVFTHGSVMINIAESILPKGTYETIIVPDENAAFYALKNGDADGFIATNTMEAAFDHLGGIHIEDFLPLTFMPAVMVAQKPEYKAIISIVSKALEAGAYQYLTQLYRQGYEDYRKHKFLIKLTEEEKEYIQNNSIIPIGASNMIYPITFYNKREEKWEGAAFDILEEIKLLTGLNFKIIHEPVKSTLQVTQLLSNNEIFLTPLMYKTPAREGRFLWSEISYMPDRYALISKQSYPNIALNDIPYQKIGIPAGTAFADMFNFWFPNALYAIEFPNTDEAIAALDRGDVDLVMVTQSRLTALTNFYELSDYKANFIFNTNLESNFGYNIEQTILRSIIDKSLPLIDTHRITEQWVSRTYNLEAMRLREQRPWFIGAIILSALVISLIIILLIKSKGSEKHLEQLVIANTSTINTIFNATPDIIFCKDLNSRYTKCNRSMEEYFGLTEAEIIGKDDIEAFNIEPEIANGYTAMDRKVIDEKKSLVFEELVPAKDGIIRPFETTKAPIIQEGIVTGIIGISRDISIRKAAELKAKTASEAKSRFIANMSHEIRTPMNSIIGFSELAQNDDIPEKTRGYLNKIQESGEMLLTIINDILDLSKIESGKMELEHTFFCLNDIFEFCKTVITPKIKEKNIELIYDKNINDDVKLEGDPVKLRQIILNILSNAVKFTEEGSIKLSASVLHTDNISCTIHFEIIDTGIGMDSEQIKKAFEPFMQGDTSITRKYGGTGLGLNITKNIIELMGGKLEVESSLKKGSKFSFDIKFNIANNIINEDKENEKIEKPVFSGEVLIFEDNKMNQEVIGEHLERVGLKYKIAENGKEGLEILKNKRFDLILMDIYMPVMDGIETSVKISQMGITTPIIALTANIMPSDLELYKKSGMKDFLGKPFTTKELWTCLDKYLN